MATTKIWDVRGWLGQVVHYVENPSKTENPVFSNSDVQGLRDVMDYATQDYKTEKQYYVSGINCLPEIARQQMLLTKKHWAKEGGIVAFHAYQSFGPDEVTPKLAHEIGLKLAQELWGERFEVIVATHLDKAHLHSHFVLNSVSYKDGKRYNDCKTTYDLLRRTSDRLCQEYGLSVIENPQRGKRRSYDTWQAERDGKATWWSIVRNDMDIAIKQAVIDRLIPENPCSLIRYPKEQPFEARFLKLPDLNTLLEAVHDMVIEPAIILAVYYALRRGEILGIRWSDIDFERNIVYIKNTRVRVGEPVEKSPKNKASLAPMPLMPNVKDYLLVLKKQQAAYAKAFGKQYHHNDYICKWQDGRPFEYKYVNSVLGRVLKKNKLPHRTLHELRHSTASLLRAQGFSLQEIQSWLRHGDIKSTMRYAHDDIDVRINASERLNGIFAVQQKVKEVV